MSGEAKFPRHWEMTCLLCGYKSRDLVTIQEHAMSEHGYTQEDHRRVKRREDGDAFVWTFADGVDWLRGVRV